MFPRTKFQSLCRFLDGGTKVSKKFMICKNFEKINIKIVISI